jgi:PPM family protein phosphatase
VPVARIRPPQAAAATDRGRERSNNEDRVLCEPDLGIFAVIDGVGGESAGEVAAETALEVLRARLSRRTTDSARLIREAIALANRQIYERAHADARLAGMSCVLTVAVLDGARATVGHVGDSRLYALAPGEIRKVTPDHSPVGAREDAGDLSESEAMRHPRRNEIFRDVGSDPHEPDDESWIDVLEAPFQGEGALLLCSDGLSDMLPGRDILETVEANAASPRAAVRALVERANAAGGRDNISAVLVVGERYAEAVRRRRSAAARASASRALMGLAPLAAEAPAAVAAGAGGVSREETPGAGAAGARRRAPTVARGAGGLPAMSPRAPLEPAAPRASEAARETEELFGGWQRTGREGRPGGGGAAAGGDPAAGSVSAASAGSVSAAAPAAWTAAAGADGGAGARRGAAGAAFARDGAGERVRSALGRWPAAGLHRPLPAILGIVVVAAVAAGVWFRAPLGALARGLLAAPAAADVLVVGIGDGGVATLGEALARARPGQTIEVAPGRYRERVVLRDGVALVSRVPRGAVLLPPAAGAGPGAGGGDGDAAEGVAVLAKGIHGARLSGFRIVADPRVPWRVGVRLEGSEVAVEEVEVSGATVAGFEIGGADRSTVRLCYIHHNAGAGIVLAGEAGSRLLANLIAGNGFRPGGAATGAPGVEIRAGASPLVAENRIEGNSGGGVTLQSPERAEEIFRWNAFGALGREQAVRVAGAPAGAASSGPAASLVHSAASRGATGAAGTAGTASGGGGSGGGTNGAAAGARPAPARPAGREP